MSFSSFFFYRQPNSLSHTDTNSKITLHVFSFLVFFYFFFVFNTLSLHHARFSFSFLLIYNRPPILASYVLFSFVDSDNSESNIRKQLKKKKLQKKVKERRKKIDGKESAMNMFDIQGHSNRVLLLIKCSHILPNHITNEDERISKTMEVRDSDPSSLINDNNR